MGWMELADVFCNAECFGPAVWLSICEFFQPFSQIAVVIHLSIGDSFALKFFHHRKATFEKLKVFFLRLGQKRNNAAVNFLNQSLDLVELFLVMLNFLLKQGVLFREIHFTNRRLCNGLIAAYPVASYVAEESEHAVVVALRDRVNLMIVTAGAVHS